jgi:hypothetical protein
MSMRDLLSQLSALEEGAKTQFAGEPTQKPGDQVRGTERAVGKKGQHPFQNRLVGSSESILRDLEAALHESPARDLMREYRDFVNEAPVPPLAPQAGQQQNPNPNQNPAQQDPAVMAAQAKLAQQQKTKQDAALQQGISKLKSAGADVDMHAMTDKNNELAPVLAPIMSNPQLQGKFQELVKQASAEQKKQQQTQQTAQPAGAVGAPVPGQK